MAPWISYELNKDYIRAYLCVNQDQPITVCGGQCYLEDQWEKQQEKEPLTFQVNMNDYPVCFDQRVLFQFEEAKLPIPQHVTHYLEPSSQHQIEEIFHPPAIFVV